MTANNPIVDEVIEKVAEACNTLPSYIKYGGRKRYLCAYPRHLSWLFSRCLTELTYAQIGYLVGNSDHSTVYAGLYSIVNMLESGDMVVCEMYKACRYALTVGNTDRIMQVQSTVEKIKQRRKEMKEREGLRY